MDDPGRAVEAQARAFRPERLLMTGLELDQPGDAVSAAVGELARSRPSVLLRILRAPPPGAGLASRIRAQVVTNEWVRGLVEADPPDFDAIDLLLEENCAAVVRPLLDLLTESDSLSVRRQLFTRLASLGGAILPEVIARCRDKRWYARRNMLALLGEMEEWPPKWSPAEHADDPHPAVRREAFKLMLRLPRTRERGLCGLLEDGDRRALGLGLAAATQGCPPEAVPLLADLATDETIESELRVMAVRAMGAAEDELAESILIDIARGGRGVPLLSRNRLAPKSPLMLAALQSLAAGAAASSEARRLLSAAARSSDRDIRSAALGGGEG